MWWPQKITFSLSFLTDSSLVLHSASVLTTGSMPAAQSDCAGNPAPQGWHIHTCNCKKVCCVSQHSLTSMEEMQETREELNKVLERASTICSFVQLYLDCYCCWVMG